VLHHSWFPPAVNESSSCFPASPTLDIIDVLDWGHSDNFVVVPHCCFSLQFPDCIWGSFSVFVLFMWRRMKPRVSSLCLSNACSAYCWLVHYLPLFIPLKLFCCLFVLVFFYLFICFSLFL
jgi:hypothetical protein